VSRIRMVVEEDGTFWVNGEPRGKFWPTAGFMIRFRNLKISLSLAAQ
jgi:hypothetical protein